MINKTNIVEYADSGFRRCIVDGKFGFINNDETISTEGLFDFTYCFHPSPYYIAINNEKSTLFQFIKNKIEFLDDFIFDEIDFPSEGMSRVRINDKWTFLNINKRTFLTELIFDYVYDFENGFAKVVKDEWENNKYLSIDGVLFNLKDLPENYNTPLNTPTSKPIYSGSTLFSNQYELTFINEFGKFKMEYYNAKDFHEGHIAVAKNSHVWTFAKLNGKLLTDFIFNEVQYFYEDKAGVKNGDKWTFLRSDGSIFAIPNKFSFLKKLPVIKLFFSDYIFSEVKFFHKGISAVRKNNKWAFIKKDGSYLTKFIFDDVKYYELENTNDKNSKAAKFYNNSFIVKKDGKWSYMNSEGKYLYDFIFDEAYYSEQYLQQKVKKGDRWTFIDFDSGQGRLLTDFIFDAVEDFKKDYIDINKKNYYDTFEGLEFKNSSVFAKVKQGDKWTFINVNGKYLTDFIFDEINYFVNGFAKVKKDNKWCYLKSDGTYVIINKLHEEHIYFNDINIFDKNIFYILDSETEVLSKTPNKSRVSQYWKIYDIKYNPIKLNFILFDRFPTNQKYRHSIIKHDEYTIWYQYLK